MLLPTTFFWHQTRMYCCRSRSFNAVANSNDYTCVYAKARKKTAHTRGAHNSTASNVAPHADRPGSQTPSTRPDARWSIRRPHPGLVVDAPAVASWRVAGGPWPWTWVRLRDRRGTTGIRGMACSYRHFDILITSRTAGCWYASSSAQCCVVNTVVSRTDAVVLRIAF